MERASTSALPLSIRYKEQPRKSTRNNKSNQLNYANLNEHLQPDPNRFYNVVQSKRIETEHGFKVFEDGHGLTLDWVLNHPESMTEPLIIKEKTGLGMRVPSENITVTQVAQIVGNDMPVEVIGQYILLATAHP